MIAGQMSGAFIVHGMAYLLTPPEYPGYLCATNPLEPENYDTISSPKPTKKHPEGTFFCPAYGDYDLVIDYDAARINLNNFYTTLDLCCKPAKA